MVKLSRTGWNNVIIFSVMGFILLINFTQKNVDRSTESVHQSNIALIEEHGVILSLTINQQTNIERIGQTWRSLPAVIQGQPLDEMMRTWHQTEGVNIEQPNDIDKSKAVIVSIVLAGQDESEYFMLMPSNGQLIIFKQSTKQWLSLPMALFSQLVPTEVIM